MGIGKASVGRYLTFVPLLVLLGCGQGMVGVDTRGEEDVEEQEEPLFDGGVLVDSDVIPEPEAEVFSDALPPLPGSGARVVFRYRSHSGGRPEAVSDGSGTISHSLSSHSRSEDRVVPGLEPRLSTVFNGVNDAYLGYHSLEFSTMLTINAWFRSSASGTRQTLFSNLDGGGFGLRLLENGNIEALAYGVDSADRTQLYSAADSTPLNDGRWHHVAARFDLASSDVLQLSIYRDGVLAVEERIEGVSRLLNSVTRPVVGADAADNQPTAHWFEGEISGVEVRNWGVDHAVLNLPWIDDGSTYLGRPAYHDAFTPGNDILSRIQATHRRYTQGISKASALYGIPFAQARHVPQGLSRSDDPADANRVFITSYYYDETAGYPTDQDGRNPDRAPTLITEIDVRERRVVRVYELPTRPPRGSERGTQTHKAGGLAVYRGSFYIPDYHEIIRFKIEDAHLRAHSGDDPGFDIYSFNEDDAEHYPTTSPGHWLDIDTNYGTLWTGVYAAETGPSATVQKYSIDSAGALTTQTPEWERALPVPRVQGAARYNSRTERGFILSSNDAAAEEGSYLIRWDLTSVRVIANLPSHAQDVDTDADGTVWLSTENGNRLQQIRETPRDLHPVIYVFSSATVAGR